MEADLIPATTDLPVGRAARCRELLRSVVALTGNLLGQAKLPAADLLGRKGGSSRRLALRREPCAENWISE